MPLEIIVKHAVYVSDTLASPTDEVAWTLQPHLICTVLTRGVSPTIDQASLVWFFGTMRRESDAASDPVPQYVPPIDIRGKYVRIEAPDYELRWFGYVLSEQIDNRGPDEDFGGYRISFGDQQFLAVGLEWFLGRETIHKSTVYNAVDGTAEIDRAIGFNTGMGDGRTISYEKRGNQDSSANIFASDPDSAVEWTAEDAVLYLLERHSPANADGDPSPVEFDLANDAIPFLEWYRPIVATEGRSVLQVLNDIIDHRRSLVWWLELVDVGGSMEAWVRVTSTCPEDINLPGDETLPQALSQIALTADDGDDRLIIKRDLARSYDRVVCRGARKRAVFTVSIASGNLEPSWRAVDETAYREAISSDPIENDHYRESHRFERVYQCFHIPPEWDGRSNDGSSPPSGSDYACPRLAQGSASIVGAEPIAMPGLRLLPTLPIKVGYDYDVATAPTQRDPEDIYPEFQRPFAVIDITGDGDWRFTHDLGNISEEDGENRTSYHLRMLSGTAGLQLSPSGKLPHVLADGHFDPENDGPSNVIPEVSYDNIRCTVCGEWDAYCEGVYPVANPTNAPVQTLYINIGERARHDWLAEGTIYDVQGGALETVATGGPLRDDRNLCVQIAQIAYEWYGQERAQVTLETHASELPCDLGDLITTIGTGAAQETVNATVSQITYQFASGKLVIQAGYAELDFAGLA